MTSKRPSSTKMRRICFLAHRYQHSVTKRWVMDCHQCGKTIDPIVGDQWDADHVLPRGIDGPDDESNLAPICAGKGSCHADKTKKGVRGIAKVKRTSDKLYGVKRPSSKLRKPEGHRYDWQRRRYTRIEEA